MNIRFTPALALSAAALAACGSATAASTSPSPSSTTTRTAAPSPTPTTSTSSTAPVLRPATCTAASLHFSIANGGVAAGNWYSLLIATNTSKVSCTLLGVPAVSYIDRRGHRVGKPAALEQDTQVARPVTVRPGERAAVALHQASPYNFSPADCGVIRTTGYVVALPHDRTVEVRVAGTTCAHAKSSSFWVMPFTKDFHAISPNP